MLAFLACRGAPDPAPPSMREGQSGEETFLALGCAGCHSTAGGVIAPDLKGLYGQEVSVEGGQTFEADDDYLRESILTPGARTVAGYKPIMPSFQGRVTEDQLDALVAYIRSLAEE
jgi:cytochrome c oxidase subunit 2